jgi:hypothetical protein
MPMISKEYIAGFIDGEGNIAIRKAKVYGSSKNPTYQPVIYITNTNKEILIKIMNFLGGGKVFTKKQIKSNWKIGNVYQWAGCKIFPTLEELRKYLIVKKPLADKICQYKRFFGTGSYKKGNQYTGVANVPREILEKRDEVYRWCKKFNEKGV